MPSDIVLCPVVADVCVCVERKKAIQTKNTQHTTQMSVRAVSFVRRYVLPFDGHMFAHALALGDADNDGVSLLRRWPL